MKLKISRNLLLALAAVIGLTNAAQARDLFMAPIDGWLNTRDGKWAAFMIRGQAAQGLYEKMPESSARKPGESCFLNGTAKIQGGLLCDTNEKRTEFECRLNIDYNTGLLADQIDASWCPEDESVYDEMKERAKNQGYWK